MSNWSKMPAWDETRVLHVDHVHLAVEPYAWPFAAAKRAAIEEGWGHALARNPAYFNGVIHLTKSAGLSASGYTAKVFPTDFKTYLHWRETGYADRSVRDTFGSALVRSKEGFVILGRQREGNINSGLTYLPGGFIDVKDIVTDRSGGQTIDIEASILREASEETGLSPSELERLPGFYITCTGVQISVACELRSQVRAADLKDRIMSNIAADAESELTDIVIVKSGRDLDGLAMPAYAAALLRTLFP